MLEPIKFFCNFALPAVYDDSLSYYEVLTKLTAKLNDVISSLNSANAKIEVLTPKVTKLVDEVGTRPVTITDTLWDYTTQQDTSILAELDRINENVGNIDGRVNSNTNSIAVMENDIDKLKSNRFVDLTGNVVFILPKQGTSEWWNQIFIKQFICNTLNKNEDSVLIEWIKPATTTPSNDIDSALLNIQAYELAHTGFSANTTALIIGLQSVPSGLTDDDYYSEIQSITNCMANFNNLKDTVILPSYGYNTYTMISVNKRLIKMREYMPTNSFKVDNSLGDCLFLGEVGDTDEEAQNNAQVNFALVLCNYILYGIHHCNYIITDSSFGFLKNINGEISYFPSGTQIVSGTVNFNSYKNAITSIGLNTNVGFGSGKSDGKECIFALAVTNNAVGSTSYTAITPYKNTIILGRKFY